MMAYDSDQVADLLAVMQRTRLYVPVLLAVMCGLRRGEIAALRWKSVDFDARTIAVVESAEQTKNVVRYKPPKNGKARVVAMSALVAEELRRHRARQAEELLKIGLRPEDDGFDVA